MANRYWRGGSGTWDASSTTNWSATSGGAGGASAPTSVDDVFFDTLSSLVGYTITVGTNAVCNSITVSAPASGVAAFSLAATSILSIYGSMLLNTASSTWTGTSGARIQFLATSAGNTITTNGISLIPSGGNNLILFNGIGGEWSLGSALTTSGIQVNNGIFRSNDFNITTTVNFLFNSTNTARGVYLGSSTVTTTGAFASISATLTTNLTFDAGTSSVVLNNSNPTINGINLTYNNVSFTSTAAGTVTITGANTFNNLTFTSPASTGLRNINVGANQTVNGTLTLGTANTAIRRMFVRSDVVGTPRTITLNGSLAALSDVDFRDIVAAGTVGTWTGTRLGNCLGNSNITFDAGKTVYWNLAGAQNWSATGWATTNNGTPSANNFPLAQDTAVFTEAGAASNIGIDVEWNIGSISMQDGVSNRTSAFTLTTYTRTYAVYGDITLYSNLVFSGTTCIFVFLKRDLQTITSNTKAFINTITVDAPGTNFSIADNFTTSAGFTLTQGTVTLNDNTLTALTFSSSNSNVRAIAFGTGKIVISGNSATTFSMGVATNFSYTGTPNVEFSYVGSTGTRINTFGSSGGATEANVLNAIVIGGSDTFQIGGANNWGTVNFTGFSGVFDKAGTLNIYRDLLLSSLMTLNASTTAIYFRSAEGTQTITTNGKTLDFPFVKLNASTLQLQDALTLGSTRTLTHTGGTVDLNGNTLTAGSWSTTGTTARNINFNNGSIVCLGAWTASGSNLTTSGGGSISMTSASAKTFAGGGASYPTLNQGGLGTLSITGNNTFADMTNTVQPTTITFAAGSTTSVSDFNVSGTAGNLVTLNSSVPGTKWTIVKV